MTYNTASIHIYTDYVVMAFSSMGRPSFFEYLTFKISCSRIDWQVSSMAQICNQLSFFLSSIEELNIDDTRGKLASICQVDMDDTQWLELFHPFTALPTLHISSPLQSLVVSALQGLSEELSMEVLSATHQTQLVFGLVIGLGADRGPSSGSSQQCKPCLCVRNSRRRLQSCQFDNCWLDGTLSASDPITNPKTSRVWWANDASLRSFILQHVSLFDYDIAEKFFPSFPFPIEVSQFHF
jgi:hypothetical protein